MRGRGHVVLRGERRRGRREDLSAMSEVREEIREALGRVGSDAVQGLGGDGRGGMGWGGL